MFHAKSLLGRCLLGFVCSAVWCSAAVTHLNLKLLDRAVSGAWFLTGGVFECEIANRRSVAILCMLYKNRCNQMHPLNISLHGPYVPVRVTLGALVAHRFAYAPLRCRTSKFRRTFIPSQCPSGTILLTLYSMVWNWRVSRAGLMLFYYPKLLYPYYSLLLFFPFSSFCLLVGIVGWGLRTERVFITLSQPCTADLF